MVHYAIIGAGLGGCSAAYYIRRYFPRSQITLYERSKRIGGRILTTTIGSGKKELGAEFFTSLNQTINTLIYELDFKVRPRNDAQSFAIWNGTEFTFKSQQSPFPQMFRLLSTYKLSILKLRSLIQNARHQVLTLYDQQRNNPSDIQNLFHKSGLDYWFTQSFDEILTQHGISRDLINEIVTPITRIIYSQNANLAGFAGISALLGAYSEKSFSLKDGNSSLPSTLVKASDSTLKLGNAVTTIEKTSDDLYQVSTETQASKHHGVLIAAPLEIAEIQFDGVLLARWAAQTFHSVYVKVLKGSFNPRYFNLNDTDAVPSLILTTAEADPITHLNIYKSSQAETIIVVTSNKPLPSEFQQEIINEGELVQDHIWNSAYPIFQPIETLPPTSLDQGLTYINTIEPAAASLESSTFAALNAVQMMKKDSDSSN
jgi:prenylcysteine oxidase/farnesylcysteine lyase